MRVTNHLNLPLPLVKAVTRHPRERLPDRISVTELIQPPQIRALSVLHDDEIVEDASDRIWALLGTLLHGVLEKSGQGLEGITSEEALEMEVGGWTLTGHYDLSELVLDGELLTDWKLSSVWVMKDGLKREWQEQINVYSQLIRHAGRTVNKAQIVLVGRDWSKAKASREKDYPQQQVTILPVPLWTPEETMTFIRERVHLHQEAAKGTWPDCTLEERWARPTQFALMKEGQKRAVKLYDDLEHAEAHKGKGNYVEERPGEWVRCRSYCAVSEFCPTLKRENAKTKEGETKND